jgi:hypothetical protein
VRAGQDEWMVEGKRKNGVRRSKVIYRGVTGGAGKGALYSAPIFGALPYSS